MKESEVREAYSRFHGVAQFRPFAKVYMLVIALCDADMQLFRYLYCDNPQNMPIQEHVRDMAQWLLLSDLHLSDDLIEFLCVEYAARFRDTYTLLPVREQLERPVFDGELLQGN